MATTVVSPCVGVDVVYGYHGGKPCVGVDVVYGYHGSKPLCGSRRGVWLPRW